MTKTWIAFLTVWSVCCVAVVVTFAGLVASWITSAPNFPGLLRAGLVVLIPAQLGRMFAQIMRNTFRPVPFAVTAALVGTLSLLFGVALAIGLGWGVLGVIVGVLIAEAIGCLVRFPMVRSEFVEPIDRRTLPALLRFGLPFVPANAAYWVFTGADRIVVNRSLGPVSLGEYSAAALLMGPFALLLIAVGHAWLPRVTQQFSLDRDAAARTTARAFELAFAGFALLAVVAGALAPALIWLMAGDAYAAGAQALPFLAVGSTFLGISGFASTGFTLAKRSGLYPVAAAVAAVVDLVLLLVLVPAFQLVGAAVAVAVAYWVLTGGLLLISQRHFPVPIQWGKVIVILSCLVGQASVATIAPASAATVVATLVAAVVLMALAWRLARAGMPAKGDAANSTPD